MTDDTSAPGSGSILPAGSCETRNSSIALIPREDSEDTIHLTVFSDDPLQAPGHRAGRLGSKLEGRGGPGRFEPRRFQESAGRLSPVPALPRILHDRISCRRRRPCRFRSVPPQLSPPPSLRLRASF